MTTRNRPVLALAGGALLAALAGCGVQHAAAAPEAAPTDATTAAGATCTPTAMRGSYLYEMHGHVNAGDESVPYLEVGELVLDGDGTGVRTATPSLSRREQSAPVTYEVGGDCIGTLTTEGGTTYRATFSPSGDEVTFFSMAAEAQVGVDGQADRSVGSTDSSCDTGTLDGTYMYRARGFVDGRQHIEHGFEVFDGRGHVTNTFRVAGIDEPQHLSGSYTVADDCRATVTYPDGMGIDQYVAPDGGEFFWIQTAGLDDNGYFGGHEHRVSRLQHSDLTDGTSAS